MATERQLRRAEAFHGALRFLDGRPDLRQGEVRALANRLATKVAKIPALTQAQDNQDQAGLLTLRRRLESLRSSHMLQLARLSRPLFRGEATILKTLRVPHRDTPAGELLVAASAMLKVLRPHKRFLEESGVDARRLTRIREECREIRRLVRLRDAVAPRRAVATRELRIVLADCRDDLNALDALVAPTLDTTALAVWRSETRVPAKRGRPRGRRQRPPTATTPPEPPEATGE